MAKKRTLNELRQVKDSVYKNPIPDDFWNELSDKEKESLAKAQEEADIEFQNYDEWTEMDESFYQHLRERFDKVLRRDWTTYSKNISKQISSNPNDCYPCRRQHNGEEMVQMFHIIVEDLEGKDCNGEYFLTIRTTINREV